MKRTGRWFLNPRASRILAAALAFMLAALSASANPGPERVGQAGVSVKPSASADTRIRPSLKADRLLVVKSERKLYAFHGSEVLRVFDVGLGRVEGAKQREGDKRTPEGVYHGCQLRRSSRYHLAITIPYPTPEQKRLGYTGSDIEIHGLPHFIFGLENLLGPLLIRSHGTRGCVILTNSDMDALAGLTAFPVTVEIVSIRSESAFGSRI